MDFTNIIFENSIFFNRYSKRYYSLTKKEYDCIFNNLFDSIPEEMSEKEQLELIASRFVTAVTVTKGANWLKDFMILFNQYIHNTLFYDNLINMMKQFKHSAPPTLNKINNKFYFIYYRDLVESLRTVKEYTSYTAPHKLTVYEIVDSFANYNFYDRAKKSLKLLKEENKKQ